MRCFYCAAGSWSKLCHARPASAPGGLAPRIQSAKCNGQSSRDFPSLPTSMNPVRSFLSSLGGALFGGICLIGSFPLLALNENRAVKTELSLKEGQKTVQTAEPAG